jgi:hypothetical protein
LLPHTHTRAHLHAFTARLAGLYLDTRPDPIILDIDQANIGFRARVGTSTTAHAQSPRHNISDASKNHLFGFILFAKH